MARPFRFKQFSVQHDRCAMKVGTDGVLLGAWSPVTKAQRILDIGTGSGLIALMCAQRNPRAHITAIEPHQPSYEQAQYNAAQSPWAQRLTVLYTTLQQHSAPLYDAIVTNPPYFLAGTTAPDTARHHARHTEGLSPQDLLGGILRLLAPHGTVALILPTQEGQAFQALTATQGLTLTHLTEVHGRASKPVERLLMAFRRIDASTAPPRCIRTSLAIDTDQRNHWTPEYRALTRDFYLAL